MRIKIISFSIIVITVLSSCSNPYRYIYTATPPNNPYFIQKGESKLAGYYSNASDSHEANTKQSGGWDFQGAYAISNHLALTAGYLNRIETDGNHVYNSEDYFIKYKRNLFDIGAGYFLALDNKKKTTINLYGGVAFGTFSFTDTEYGASHKSAITKPYFQPSLNYSASSNFRMSFGSRFSFVHYGNIETSYSPSQILELNLDLIDDRTIFFFEPAFNVQFGVKEFPAAKVDISFSGTSKPFPTEYVTLRSRTSSFSIGLSFDISKLRKEK